jgi:hypothetical protein
MLPKNNKHPCTLAPLIMVNNHNVLNGFAWRSPKCIGYNAVLSNDFRFIKPFTVTSVRYDFIPTLCEWRHVGRYTQPISILKTTVTCISNYWACCLCQPGKKWKNDVSITFTYRRTVQRLQAEWIEPSVVMATRTIPARAIVHYFAMPIILILFLAE